MSPILSGSVNVDQGVLITIPAGASWIGSVQLSCLSSGPAIASITVEGGGDGVSPNVGTSVVACAVFNAANGLIANAYVVAGNENATLRLNFNGATSAVGVANGYTL